MRTPPNESLTSDIAEARRPRKPEPERRCILTGETGPRDALLRLVASPSGLVLPDAQEKAPGRGAWVSSSRTAIEEAKANGKLKAGLARAFKTGDLEIPEDLPQKIEDALTRVFLDRLGLEMRVGALILGTQRIAETARMGGVSALFHARDASEDGRKKLDQAWRVGREAEGSGERGWTLPLDREVLSVALGRDNVVHFGLADDAATARVLKPFKRLMHYLGQEIPSGSWTDEFGRASVRTADDTND
ncbi:DUF448 domain-containing protein [Erythrobacter vulgaris]|uniref:DUF448 domain-containing protein n=1 Tax=Qipengyuania vulgaris TaxID=291985 RepID=A0A844XR33_9SPHN|nr:DUF448 domain-containing protein [Qipengyuania vulgaris]MXO47884.1 DUF448 domain-containing protein [Qipengyuania vulgaris]